MLLGSALSVVPSTGLASAPSSAYDSVGGSVARQALRRQASGALEQLRQRTPALRVSWAKHRVTPQLVSGLREATVGKTPAARAQHFLGAHQGWLRASLGNLAVARTSNSRDRIVVAFEQRLEGIIVTGKTLAVTMDAAGRVLRVQNDLETVRRFDRGTLTRAAAIEAAKNAMFGDGASVWAKAQVTTREVWVVQRGWALRAWEVSLAVGLLKQRVVSVAATDGRVFGIRNPILH